MKIAKLGELRVRQTSSLTATVKTAPNAIGGSQKRYCALYLCLGEMALRSLKINIPASNR